MPIFPTYEYLGYQVGLRTFDKNRRIKEVRRLSRGWRYALIPLFNGRNIRLDLLTVATKKALETRLNYSWRFLSPDGEKEYKSGAGIIDHGTQKAHRHVIDLGHVSIAGQYRIDLHVSNEVNAEVLDETMDIDIHNFGDFEYHFLQTVLLIVVSIVLSVVLTTVMRACGFAP